MADLYDPAVGWTLVPDLVTADEIVEIQRCCDEELRRPASELLAGDRAHGGTQHLMGLDERCPIVADVIARPLLVAVVDAILGPAHRADQISYRCPQPGFGGQFLHADAPPALGKGPATVATAIVALVDVDEGNGSTRFVPGSHLRPDLQRQSGSLERHDDEMVFVAPAGTALVFSGHLLHSGTPNRSPRPRPALQLVWRAQVVG